MNTEVHMFGIAWLEVISHRGFGGRHAYGTLWTEDDDNPSINLRRTLTREDAARLNRSDDCDLYEEGHNTKRFDGETEVTQFAIKNYRKLAPGATVLIRGDHCVLSPQKVLHGPPKFVKVAKELYHRWETSVGDEMEAVEDEWDKLIAEHKHMDYKRHADELLAGKTVQFRPKGNSMEPKISSGNLVTVEPVASRDPREPAAKKGDVVFCRVGRNYYVHKVLSVKQKLGGWRYQIGNNKGHTNGTIGLENVFGKVVRVEP